MQCNKQGCQRRLPSEKYIKGNGAQEQRDRMHVHYHDDVVHKMSPFCGKLRRPLSFDSVFPFRFFSVLTLSQMTAA